MSEWTQGRWILGAPALSFPFMADFFTLTYVPKVTQALPVAVYFPEQEVSMNECPQGAVFVCAASQP